MHFPIQYKCMVLQGQCKNHTILLTHEKYQTYALIRHPGKYKINWPYWGNVRLFNSNINFWWSMFIKITITRMIYAFTNRYSSTAEKVFIWKIVKMHFLVDIKLFYRNFQCSSLRNHARSLKKAHFPLTFNFKRLKWKEMAMFNNYI